MIDETVEETPAHEPAADAGMFGNVTEPTPPPVDEAEAEATAPTPVEPTAEAEGRSFGRRDW